MIPELWFRRALLATGVLNLGGALTLAPVFPNLRVLAGLPEAGHPLYAWLLALWTLFFGLAYLRLAFAPTPERLFLQVATAGKASFTLLLVAFWLRGVLPIQAPLAGLSDLFFAMVFVVWLYQTRAVEKPGESLTTATIGNYHASSNH